MARAALSRWAKDGPYVR